MALTVTMATLALVFVIATAQDKTGLPIFLINDQPVVGKTAVIANNDSFKLTCLVDSGELDVQNVSIMCGFKSPFSTLLTLIDYMKGNAYVIDLQARRDMHNKSCLCLGGHITGHTDVSILRFNITHPPIISNFIATKTVDLYDPVTLTCEANGNPTPSVAIVKLRNGAKSEELDKSFASGTVNVSFRAECTHNGKYQCVAENEMRAIAHHDTRYQDIRVKCLPTACKTSHIVETMDRKSDDKVVVTLCVVAYPLPEKDQFLVQKEVGGDWNTEEPEKIKATVELDSNVDDVLENITITFDGTKSDFEGNYRVGYPYNNGSGHSFIFFRIKSTSKGQDSSIVTIVCVVILLIVIVVIVAVVLVYIRRKRCTALLSTAKTGTARNNEILFINDTCGQSLKKGAKEDDEKSPGKEIEEDETGEHAYANTGSAFSHTTEEAYANNNARTGNVFSNTLEEANVNNTSDPCAVPMNQLGNELTYVELDFDPDTASKAVNKDLANLKGSGVEYSDISFSATPKSSFPTIETGAE